MNSQPLGIELLLPSFKYIEKFMTNEDSCFCPDDPRYIISNTIPDEFRELLIEDKRILTNKASHGYLDIYSKLLSKYINKPLVLIELGLGSVREDTPSTMFYFKEAHQATTRLEYFPGGSLRLFQRYFDNPNNFYIGWDIDIENVIVDNASLIQVDTTNESDLSNAMLKSLELIKGFNKSSIDIFIDDGLHTFNSQLNTFLEVYPHISDGGLYIIEDVSTAGDEFEIDKKIYPGRLGKKISSSKHSLDLRSEIQKFCQTKVFAINFAVENRSTSMILVSK